MSFQQGISGLNAASRNLEVIGNNIANANTVGAKVSRAEFAGIYASAAMQGVTAMPGMGVQVTSITQQFSQGALRTTENPLDIAINGNGFFCVAEPGSADAGYTRNGAFQLDRQGHVVTTGGLRLQGFAVDAASGRSTGVAGDIKLPADGIAPQVTTKGELAVNLDARTAAPSASTPAFALNVPDSYASTTSMPVYDQQGNEHTLSLYFRRAATDNEWEVYAGMDGTNIPAAAGGAVVPAGTLKFNADGTLDAGSAELELDVPFPAGTLPVAPSTSTADAPVKISLTGTTQFGSAFGVNAVGQDGYAAGQLTGFAVDARGMVQARYSNGKTVPAAQVALADFANEQGLVPVGNNVWRATPDSGEPAIGAPGTANLGALQGGALEESNIDLTQQLVDMITAQRAYQANAQTIKTQDQMLSTLVNLR
ncbi:flagellar hook protein FlgE [Ramlibacter sp.]|uniref:flagellar hook protein FlgE n=1 Tax=Ramlibacter sp. TaxID=1917967 RepID=UPI003D132017